MVRIGNIILDAPFFQAGLAGYSDAAMRLVARRHGCPYCITEAMLDQFLISGGKALKRAELDEKDHPIAGQLMGSHPRHLAAAASIMVRFDYDCIDVNLACPVKKIRKKSRGGHLLSAPDQAVAILDAVRQAVPGSIPCTVKMRRAADESPDAAANFTKILSKAIELGYTGVVVHGRTVEQKYAGPSQWSFLKNLVADYGNVAGFTIGGSGDIWQAADIFRMIRETGVQLVSVARGCIGNPWIFAQARALMSGDEASAARPPTIAKQRQVLFEHFDLAVRLHGERQGSMMMRKFGIKFSLHHPEPQFVKEAFIKVKAIDDWRGVLDRFYREDGNGRVVDLEAAHTQGASGEC